MSRILKFHRSQVCEEYSTWGRITVLSTILAITELTPWIVSLAFVGRVSSLQLAALSLVEVWVYSFLEVAWVSVTQAGSVLISQAEGAGSENATLGWLAISMIVMTIASAIVALASVFSAKALNQFTDDRELVEAGSFYASWITPAIFFASYQQMIATYLIATGHVEYPTICAFIYCFLDIFITYIFMFGGLGIQPYENALLATAMSWNLSSVLSLALIGVFFWRSLQFSEEDKADDASIVYLEERAPLEPEQLGASEYQSAEYEYEINPFPQLDEEENKIVDKIPPMTSQARSESPRRILAKHHRISSSSNVAGILHRGSIDLADLEDVILAQNSIVDWIKSVKAWKVFSSMLLPFAVSVSTEMAIFFVMAFFAAKLGRAQIAAHNTCSAILEYTFSIIIGMAEATSVRTGYYVGKGDLTGCMTVAWVSIVNSLLIGLVVAVVCGMYSQEIAEVFTSDTEIINYILQVSPLLWASFAIFAVGDQMLAILEGQGRGSIQMFSSFIGLWLVTLPLAFWLFYYENGGLRDLWWALLIGYIVNEVTATCAVYYSKWDSIFDHAKDHITLD